MNTIRHGIFLGRRQKLKKTPFLLFVRIEEENKRLKEISVHNINFKFLLVK